MKDTFFSSKFSFNVKGILSVYSQPLVMGILNVTPDSFYEGSRLSSVDDALQRAEKMIEEGASILDIGGYSSRPGADDISEAEEIKRTSSIIAAIKSHFPETLISIDTFRSTVANEAVLQGADLINDISGGQADSDMYATAAKHNCPYIMMHMKGTPQTMMKQAHYENLLNDIIFFFSEQIKRAQKAGVKDIIIDPGFGFSKTIAHNFQLLNQLDLLHALDCPLLIGVSRKSMIYKSLNATPAESLNGTTVLNTIALQKGAHILRVHDVKEAFEAVKLCQLVQ